VTCTNLGCREVAVATVPGYPDPLEKCFTHEREYVDRYGADGVRPLEGAEMSEQQVAERIGQYLRDRGLIPTQPRYRYWESPDGWQFLYTVEKVEDDKGRERYQSAIYQPKGPGSQSGPKAWTRRTRMVLRRERSHTTRRAAKARAHKLYQDHILEMSGRTLARTVPR
jgi:hypothetical protein